jgi:hypothetical protein
VLLLVLSIFSSASLSFILEMTLSDYRAYAETDMHIASGPMCSCKGQCQNPVEFKETIVGWSLYEKFDNEKGVSVFMKKEIKDDQVICTYTSECQCLHFVLINLQFCKS